MFIFRPYHQIHQTRSIDLKGPGGSPLVGAVFLVGRRTLGSKLPGKGKKGPGLGFV